MRLTQLKDALTRRSQGCIEWLIQFTREYQSDLNTVLSTRFEELPLLVSEDYSEAVHNVLKTRLAGKPVYGPDIRDILIDCDMSSQDYANLHRNDGELSVCADMLGKLGYTEEADQIRLWLYSY